jgi:hypothetical protein
MLGNYIGIQLIAHLPSQALEVDFHAPEHNRRKSSFHSFEHLLRPRLVAAAHVADAPTPDIGFAAHNRPLKAAV